LLVLHKAFTLQDGNKSETDATQRALLEGNLSSEIGMIVLDVVCLYTNTFKVKHHDTERE
jgi:hypothetical protein